MALGIATVYQEPQLFSELTVSENIFMGREIRKGGRIDWAEQTRRGGGASRAARTSAALRHGRRRGSVDRRAQQVSIAKALAGDANILILDEPSAILTDAEIEILFRVVRRLTESGVSVIYISHRLDELFRIAQDVLVMRDGQTIGTYPIGELSVRKVVELMVGGILTETKHERKIDPETKPRLELVNLSRRGDYHDVNVVVRPGEVVGLYGLVGSGVSEIADSIYGIEHPDAGRILLDGQPVSAPLSTARAAPGDRFAAGRTARNRGCSLSNPSCSTSPPGTSHC